MDTPVQFKLAGMSLAPGDGNLARVMMGTVPDVGEAVQIGQMWHVVVSRQWFPQLPLCEVTVRQP